MQTLINNSQTLAHGSLEAAGEKWTARPYNRFEPERTIWWLVPETTWPAYNLFKLFFDGRGNSPAEHSVFCGLVAEKGLGSELTALYKVHKALILADDWYWHKLEGTIRNRTFETALGSLEKGEKEIFIKVGLHFISPETLSTTGRNLDSFEQIRDKMPLDYYIFKYKDGKLELALKQQQNFDSKIRDYPTKKLGESKTVTELWNNIKQLPQQEWYWVNFYTGTCVDSQEKVNYAKLWNENLEPWGKLI